MTQQRVEKAEIMISWILRWGVLLCAAVIAGGWVLSFIQGHGLAIVHSAMSGKELHGVFIPRHPQEFWQGLAQGDSEVIVALGLLLLILLPVTRVATSAVVFLLEKDYLFVAMSVFVFSVLVFSMVMGRAL
jgi:uncharacterized membrane protein